MYAGESSNKEVMPVPPSSTWPKPFEQELGVVASSIQHARLGEVALVRSNPSMTTTKTMKLYICPMVNNG